MIPVAWSRACLSCTRRVGRGSPQSDVVVCALPPPVPPGAAAAAGAMLELVSTRATATCGRAPAGTAGATVTAVTADHQHPYLNSPRPPTAPLPAAVAAPVVRAIPPVDVELPLAPLVAPPLVVAPPATGSHPWWRYRPYQCCYHPPTRTGTGGRLALPAPLVLFPPAVVATTLLCP